MSVYLLQPEVVNESTFCGHISMRELGHLKSKFVGPQGLTRMWTYTRQMNLRGILNFRTNFLCKKYFDRDIASPTLVHFKYFSEF